MKFSFSVVAVGCALVCLNTNAVEAKPHWKAGKVLGWQKNAEKHAQKTNNGQKKGHYKNGKLTTPNVNKMTTTDTSTNRCGIDWSDANRCSRQLCPNNRDDECPDGQQCFSDMTVNNCDDTTKRCGTTWDTANSCTQQLCPGGTNTECDVDGESCFSNIDVDCSTPPPVTDFTKRCGTNWDTANSCTQQLCPQGDDIECSVSGESCFANITVDCSTPPPITDFTKRCGTTWDTANVCGQTFCPGNTDEQCPQGESCWSDMQVTGCDDMGNGNVTEPENCGNDFLAQCGGRGFTGETCCKPGFTCVPDNVYYSGCLPATDFEVDTIPGTADDFPRYQPAGIPALPQLHTPPMTSDYPTNSILFDDSQILRIDFTTANPLNMLKDWEYSNITIQSMTRNVTMNNIGARYTGQSSLGHTIKNYYFKAGEFVDNPDFFDEWDRFSVKKSMFDTTLLRDKVAMDLSNALGYIPRSINYAAVTENGKYWGLYTIIQRTRKQWIVRTYGEDPVTGKRGSHYSGDKGTLADLDNALFEEEYQNKVQSPLPFQDLQEFAAFINSDAANNVTQLQAMVDYDHFAKAAVLDYYTGDGDGYFTNHKNYEWYHDVITNKWNLLRMDHDNGFRYGTPAQQTYTISATPTIVHEKLLQDPAFVTKYETLLRETATTVFPYYDGTGPKPAYMTRYEMLWQTVHQYDTYDRTQHIQDRTIATVEDLSLPINLLGLINDASRRAIEVLDNGVPGPDLTKRCGRTWTEANQCGQQFCSSGMSTDCTTPGETCFSDMQVTGCSDMSN